jgi:hypothetical protein
MTILVNSARILALIHFQTTKVFPKERINQILNLEKFDHYINFAALSWQD